MSTKGVVAHPPEDDLDKKMRRTQLKLIDLDVEVKFNLIKRYN